MGKDVVPTHPIVVGACGVRDVRVSPEIVAHSAGRSWKNVLLCVMKTFPSR
jgi:hypothetical protein